jgi:hypothetical protein
LSPGKKARYDALVIVLSVTLVAGMAVALLLILLWRSHPETITEGIGFRAAIAVCPPFMLVGVVPGVADNTLELVLTTGTIVIANGSLYAGLAAFVYWALSTFRPRSRSR